MTEWHQMISYLLTTELRILLCLYLVSRLMDFIPDKKAYFLTFSGGIFITALYVTPLPTAAVMTTEIIILSAVTWYCLRTQLRMCLFLIFFYEIGITFWEFLISAWLGVLFDQKLFIEAGTIESLSGIWLVRILMLLITVLLFKKQHTRKGWLLKLTSIIAVLGLFSIISLSQQSVLPFSDDQLIGWIVLSMILMFAILFYRMKCQHEMEAEITQLKQNQAEILERDYHILSKSYADNAKLYHDLHNHIEAIYQCLMQGHVNTAIQYCEDLRTPVQEITQSVWTGDQTVDYLISSKMTLARQLNIQTTVNIEYPHNTNIRSIDLTTILGNLLDNAIEASETAADSLRFLNLTIRRINDMLIIKVENGCENPPLLENGMLKTSKKNKEFHGWGIKSVLAATDRYDGTLDTVYHNNVFQAVASLSYHPVKRI